MRGGFNPAKASRSVAVAGTVAGALALMAFPLAANAYYLRLLTTMGMYVILGMGLNVLTGQAGLLDMGYMGFFAVGAYARALLASPQLGLHLPFSVTWAVAIGAGIMLSLAVGIPTLRLRGDYLAIVTLGFAEIVRILLQNLDRPINITNGPNGIIQVDPISLGNVVFDNPTANYYLILAFAVAAYAVYGVLERSAAGLRWRALKDDPVAAESFGVDVARYRVLAFSVGAAYAATAGVLFASWQGAVFPQNFTLGELITLYCMVILGGAGNPKGTLVGVAVLVAVPELLRGYSVYRMLIYGVVLLALMALRPQGLLPPQRRRTSTPAGRPKAPSRRADTSRTSLPALAVKSVGCRFGGLAALEDVSFDLLRGEVLSIIGPNGAGKTTLINIISGVTRPTSGECLLYGERITGLPPHSIYRRGLARTFQNLRLFAGMTGLENILVGARAIPDGMDDGLAAALNEPANNLSYANRKSLEIARAVAGDPDVVLLDEPAAGMSASERGYLSDQIRLLRDGGKSVVLIEHQMDLVMSASDRVIVLDRGRKIAEGTPSAVARDPVVAEVYLGHRGMDEEFGSPATVESSGKGGEPLLELAGVEACYGAVKALQGVDLRVMEGEIVCLLGANGAGKSTTLKTVIGGLTPTSGRVLFNGRDITMSGTLRSGRRGIAIVPEGRRVFAGMTVEENLQTGASSNPGGAKERDGLEYVYSVFPRLSERRGQSAGTLSGGEQQMLAIGRALMAKPRLLLMDEPSMGLAPVACDRIFEVLSDLNRAGTTVLLVEQNAGRALLVSHRGYVLRSGLVAAQGSAAELLGSADLHNAYLAADSVQRQS